eukprot:scaffold41187_cov303-Isochrysis_galbana.AAC.1
MAMPTLKPPLRDLSSSESRTASKMIREPHDSDGIHDTDVLPLSSVSITTLFELDPRSALPPVPLPPLGPDCSFLSSSIRNCLTAGPRAARETWRVRLCAAIHRSPTRSQRSQRCPGAKLTHLVFESLQATQERGSGAIGGAAVGVEVGNPESGINRPSSHRCPRIASS